MSVFFGEWQALVVLFVAGVLPNEIWRMLGLWLGGGLDEDAEFLVWVRATATAILAGVITQILIAPPGELASIPIALRFGAAAAGFVAFFFIRKSVLAGVVVGETCILIAKYIYG